MSSEAERDPFEYFGDLEANEPSAQQAQTPAGRETRPAFTLAGFAAGLAAPLWAAAAFGGAVAYWGFDAIIAMDSALLAALCALTLAPALLFWATAVAIREAAGARRLAAELALMARESRAPFEAGHVEAGELGAAVRTEIRALSGEVFSAMRRLAELEHSAKRSSGLIGETLHASQANTAAMTQALQREREALAQINGDLRGQTEEVANTIGRQVRLMREAAKIVKSEIIAAENALQTHLASFSESASAIAQRTVEFHDAADEAAAATASLNETMAEMLDSLGEATRLADAARKSSEQAVHIANETAGALRDTTRSAVVEAKQAAQLMRAETQALQHSAADTLAKLQEAAHAARAASEESQAAANRHADMFGKRAQRNSARPRIETPRSPEAGALHAAAQSALTRRQLRTRGDAAEQPRNPFKGFGSWGNFVPQTRAEERPEVANEDADLLSFGGRDPDLALKDYALDLVIDAGVDLDDVLQTSDLERIARRSREGASARRAAVVDAAPGAVTRIARYVKRNTKAHMVANEFRARPDLAKSERKGEGSNLVRAYLLIDAALA